MDAETSSPDFAALARQFDRYGMAAVLQRSPRQIETALTESTPELPQGGFRQVVVAGMGGSALPVDVVADLFQDELRVPLRIHRDYGLPPNCGDDTLLICSSFSGNTEETLSAAEAVPSRAPNTVVITAGGRLRELAEERSLALLRIPAEREPKGFQPRCATGYFVGFLARALHHAGLIDDSAERLLSAARFVSGAELRGQAEELSLALQGRVPVLYTSQRHLNSVARIGKIKFNEHAKRPAFFNALPEANHNEMIGFTTAQAPFTVVYLHDPDSHPRVGKRFEVMKQVFDERGLSSIRCLRWEMPGDTNAERVLAALAFLDWCAFNSALLDGLDPTPVALVESFKKAIA